MMTDAYAFKVGIEHTDKNRPISQYMAIMNVKASPIFYKNLFIDKNILRAAHIIEANRQYVSGHVRVGYYLCESAPSSSSSSSGVYISQKFKHLMKDFSPGRLTGSSKERVANQNPVKPPQQRQEWKQTHRHAHS
ncbi:hypothetical protein VNO80_25372 [Phaseolus coccineus]|uniref:Uncharacterized protein n=1 Tax=Phaseolus coccineus TaxID=3886 RepID=A0AAN9LUR9_PHACN